MKLKKRLPALLLAMFLAFTSLTLVFPVSANNSVLDGSDINQPAIISFNGLDFPFPSFLNPDVDSFILAFRNDSYILLVPSVPFQSLKPYSSDVTISLISAGNITTYKFSDGAWVYNKTEVYAGTSIAYGCSFFACFNVDSSIIQLTQYYDERVSSLEYFPAYSLSSPGVLSVFSGVSSWLGGAVNNMITMFYSAESGLTVLGVLAVASLAFAFILLLIYLIAGWLKFR